MEQSTPPTSLRRLTPYLAEIPPDPKRGMRVPARVFADEQLLSEIADDRSLWQLANTASLPGIVGAALAMPDIHEGYGFPIGGVVATRMDDGVISPGGIGFDINCGVRLLLSNLHAHELQKPDLEKWVNQIFRDVPSGVGRGGDFKMTAKQMDQLLEQGVPKMLDWGFVESDDLAAIESDGHLKTARAGLVSDFAKRRGADQLGTLGSGNHFIEIQRVDEIFDQETAQAWELSAGRVCILIHTGSRGLGHQTCTDYVRRMLQKQAEWGIELVDRELACAPLSSQEGRDYMAAMAACANFAWGNRQLITHRIREATARVLGKEHGFLRILYDVAHNIAKIETHMIDGQPIKLCVHRKGAIRAFPKGHPELADSYRLTGQPVLVPGTMGTSSYVLVGTPEAMERSFGTVCHGAGRRMGRREAKRKVNGSQLRAQLENDGILVRCESSSGLAEEAPIAYKDVDAVVRVVEMAGLARKVARLKPLAVIKGG